MILKQGGKQADVYIAVVENSLHGSRVVHAV